VGIVVSGTVGLFTGVVVEGGTEGSSICKPSLHQGGIGQGPCGGHKPRIAMRTRIKAKVIKNINRTFIAFFTKLEMEVMTI
jgi:hypothetical protein